MGDTDKNTETGMNSMQIVSNESESRSFLTLISDKHSSVSNVVGSNWNYEDVLSPVRSPVNNLDNILQKGRLYIYNCMSTIHQLMRDVEKPEIQSEISNHNDASAFVDISSDIGKNKGKLLINDIMLIDQ